MPSREYKDPSGLVLTEEAVAKRPGGASGLALVGSEVTTAATEATTDAPPPGPRVTCWRRIDGLLLSPDAHANAVARGAGPREFVPYAVDEVVVATPLATPPTATPPTADETDTEAPVRRRR